MLIASRSWAQVTCNGGMPCPSPSYNQVNGNIANFGTYIGIPTPSTIPNAVLLGGTLGAFTQVSPSARFSYNSGTLDLATVVSAGSIGGTLTLPNFSFNAFGQLTAAGSTNLGSAALVNVGTALATVGLLNAGKVDSGNDQFTGGVEIGSPTGGMPGSGTLNAAALLLNNVSVITANQAVTLTGAVTGSGSTAITTSFETIAAGSVLGNAGTAAGVATIVPFGGLPFISNASIIAGGTFGSGSAVPVLTVATDGQITNMGTVAVTPVPETINANGTNLAYTLTAADIGKAIQLATSGNPTLHGSPSTVGAGFWADVFNGSNAGSFAPSSGTIAGLGTLYLGSYQAVRIVSDGTNFNALYGSQWLPIASGSPAIGYGGGVGIGNLNTIGSASYNLTVGQSNTNNGNGTGIFGNSNSSSAADSLLAGDGNSSSAENFLLGHNLSGTGTASFLHGMWATDRGVRGIRSHGAGATAITDTLGGSSWDEIVMRGTGAGTIAIRALTNNSGTGAVNNTGTLLAHMGGQFAAYMSIRDVTNGGVAWFVGQNAGGINVGGIAQLGTAASNTTMVAGFSMVSIGTLGSIAALGTASIIADTTNGGFNLSYTPGAGNTATIDVTGVINMVPVL